MTKEGALRHQLPLPLLHWFSKEPRQLLFCFLIVSLLPRQSFGREREAKRGETAREASTEAERPQPTPAPLRMPPRCHRLVVDERQPPPIAAPQQEPPLLAPHRASCSLVSGVVSIESHVAADGPTDIALQRPLLPASVLQRMPEAARRMYQSPQPRVPGEGHAGPTAHGSDDAAPVTEKAEGPPLEPSPVDVTASSLAGGKRARTHSQGPNNHHHRPQQQQSLPSSPTGSALEEDVIRQIAARRKGRPATPAHPSGASPSSAEAVTRNGVAARSTKPLILSNRWSRLRVGAVVAGSAAEDEGSDSGATSASSSEGGEEEGEEDERGDALPAFANGSDDVIRFGSSRRARDFAGGEDGEDAFARKASALSESDDGTSTTTPTQSGEEDDDAVYDDADVGDDGFLDGTGIRKDMPEDRRKLIVADPALEKRIRGKQLTHQRREREREAKLRTQFNRHLAGYDDDALQAQERALLASDSDLYEEDSDGDDGEATSEEEEEEDSAGEEGICEPPAVRARNESGGGFGARFRHPQRDAPEEDVGDGSVELPESAPLAHRQRFGSIFFETHVKRSTPSSAAAAYPCHHTLLCLRGPITIQGPCGLIGFGIGEASVGGFLLGKKQLVLGSNAERAVLMPMKKLKTKTSELMELPDRTAARRSVLAKSLASSCVPAIDPLHANTETQHVVAQFQKEADAADVSKAAEGEGEEEDADMNDVEAVFGEIDWDWVQATIKAWRELFKDHLPTMLLVIQPFNVAGHHQRHRRGADAGGGQDLPLFHNPMRRHYLHSARAKRRMRQQRQLQAQHRRDGRGLPEEADDGRNWIQKATDEEVARLESREQRLRGEGRGEDEGEEGARATGTPSDGRKKSSTGAKAAGGGDGAYVEIPSFISRQPQQNIDIALVPDIVPSTTRLLGSGPTGGSLVVIGSQDVGKSTLCRFLANALLSQHGLCFWLDLDLGQPEFGVPGQLGLYCVRRPLLRSHDAASAELVKSVFVGSSTASSPQTVSSALAVLCRFVADEVSRRHPVVVNTHGWVLHTGRRVTVEAVQRLLPKAVIHLVKDREEAWASDTASLMNPLHGLNADVVGKRFLVRDLSCSGPADGRRGRQGPHRSPHQRHDSNDSRGCGASAGGDPFPLLGRLPRSLTSRAATGSAWDGTVYTVRVSREADTLRLRAERRRTKGTAGRQQLWQAYLAPLLGWYEGAARAEGGAEASQPSNASLFPATATSLLAAPLSHVASVVLAEREARVTSAAELAATLEHRVVAVQLRLADLPHAARALPSPPSSPPVSQPCIVGLDGLPEGFEVTCFGYVESTEREMLSRDGRIAIRLPVAPEALKRLLSCGTPRVSLAVSPGALQDTHFMECYP